MNDIISEWVQKAEGDYHTAEREFRAESFPNFDAVCFHAQQCVEKLLKALLIARGEVPPKTHDLLFLFKCVHPHLPEIIVAAEELKYLTRSAVDFRYPGEAADQQEAEEALTIGRRLRTLLLAQLQE
jgi:HEPN domain-containing protein